MIDDANQSFPGEGARVGVGRFDEIIWAEGVKRREF